MGHIAWWTGKGTLCATWDLNSEVGHLMPKAIFFSFIGYGIEDRG